MCRSNCIEGSECELRVQEFFVKAGMRVGWRGRDADELVWVVMEAVESGALDRYGVCVEDEGGELGYNERYRTAG